MLTAVTFQLLECIPSATRFSFGPVHVATSSFSDTMGMEVILFGRNCIFAASLRTMALVPFLSRFGRHFGVKLFRATSALPSYRSTPGIYLLTVLVGGLSLPSRTGLGNCGLNSTSLYPHTERLAASDLAYHLQICKASGTIATWELGAGKLDLKLPVVNCRRHRNSCWTADAVPRLALYWNRI